MPSWSESSLGAHSLCWFFHVVAQICTEVYRNFRTDRPEQTVWIKISYRSSLIRVYTVCHSIYIFWTNYSLVKWCCSNFRRITAILRVPNCLDFFFFDQWFVSCTSFSTVFQSYQDDRKVMDSFLNKGCSNRYLQNKIFKHSTVTYIVKFIKETIQGHLST